MTFQAWSDYVGLLDEMRSHSDEWRGATTFEEFDALVRTNCADLIERSDGYGYQALVAALDEDFTDRDQLYEQLRICALAHPAADAGLTGDEWVGYHVSTRRDGQQVYATDRFAATSDWAPLEVSVQALTLQYDDETGLMYDAEHWYLTDGRTEVWADADGTFGDQDGNRYVKGVLQAESVADLREQQFDATTNRWRQWHAADEEFEYYHNVDGVWERLRDSQWHRRYNDSFGWLAYDESTETWLDPTRPTPTWRPHGEVGAAVAAAAAEAFERMPDKHQAVLSDLAQQAVAMKPASMSDEQALRLLSEAVSAEAAEVSS
jgi:hypothetical protein